MTMVLSVSVVSHSEIAYDYLVGPIDFADAVGNTNTLGFAPSGQASVWAMDVDGSKALRINRGWFKYDSWVNGPTYDSTGKNGIVVEFKFKNTLNMPLVVGLNSNQPLILIESNGDVKATDSGKTLCKVEADKWYTYTATIDYSTKTILFTVKDSSGNVLCNTPHVQPSGAVANEMVAKANSFIRFKMNVMPGEGNYDLGYLDDFSVRAITADDIASIPEYAITNFKFSSADASPGDVTASANVLSIASDGQTMTFIVLLKNKATGELVSANADIQTVNSAEKTLSAMLTIPDDGNEYEVYAHIWDTFLDMNTLIKPINLK